MLQRSCWLYHSTFPFGGWLSSKLSSLEAMFHLFGTQGAQLVFSRFPAVDGIRC